MRKIIKLINIIAIFVIMAAFLSQGPAYSSDISHLRAPLLFGDKKEKNFLAYTIETKISDLSFSRGQGGSEIRPENEMSLEEIIDYLEEHPNDINMVIYLNDLIEEKGKDAMDVIITRFKANPNNPILFGILMEADGSEYPEAFETFKKACRELGKEKILKIWLAHPAVATRAKLQAKIYLGELKLKALFDQNRQEHKSINQINIGNLPFRADLFTKAKTRKYAHIETLRGRAASSDISTGTGLRKVAPEETLKRIKELPLEGFLVEDTLVGYGFNGTYIMGVEWKLNLKVSNGRNNYVIKGITSSSGKGLTHEACNASTFMELIERCSVFAGITENFPEGYVVDKTMVLSSLSELQKKGLNALDPNLLSLSFPYYDERINWIWGEVVTEKGTSKILVPAQLVFMESNFDEPQLARDTSNGIASGNVMDEAKLHALLEVIERDGDFTMLYSPDKCFTIAVDPKEHPIGNILNIGKRRGIVYQFLDLTTEFGVPTYRAFVKIGGQILSGSGAHLDAKIAITRALGETNAKIYGYLMMIAQQQNDEKDNEKKLEISQDIHSGRVLKLEDLPNYSTGNIEEDLALTEQVLIRSGFNPTYVDLTRKDLQVPVVRAIVPGLEIPDGISERQVLHLTQELEKAGMLNTGIPQDLAELLKAAMKKAVKTGI